MFRTFVLFVIFLSTFSPLLITGAPTVSAAADQDSASTAAHPTNTSIPGSNSTKPTTPIVTAPTAAPPQFTTTTISGLPTSTVVVNPLTSTTVTNIVFPSTVSSKATPSPANSTSTSIIYTSSTTTKVPKKGTNIFSTATSTPTPTSSLASGGDSDDLILKESVLNSLKNAVKLWDEINLENILQNKGIISNETTDKTTEAFYNIFYYGQMCSDWFPLQDKVDDEHQYPLFEDIKNATGLLITATKDMYPVIDEGLNQKNIFEPKDRKFLNLTLGRTHVHELMVYFGWRYNYSHIAENITEFCSSDSHRLIASEVLKSVNKSLGSPVIQNDPLNEIIFTKTANVFIDGMKHFILLNMACDVLTNERSFNNSVLHFLGKPRNDMNKIFYDIYANDYVRKLPLLKKEFKNGVISIIDEYLDKYGGESQSTISEKIYKNLISTYSEYKFAVGVYSQPNALLLTEGDNVFSNSKTIKGKNAFVIANQKSPTNGYKECKFWELPENEVCDETNKDKFKNIIPILKKHCNEISDIGVIKLTPHLLDGYVSVKFDRESNAFSMSGLGLGECFHYSIFVANALA